MLLNWKPFMPGHEQADLGRKKDGISFCLSFQPTCYRRGPWKLLIEVCGGPNHLKWGCFDEQDQPVRYYHSQENAKSEAEMIAKVLFKDRQDVATMEKDHAKAEAIAGVLIGCQGDA